MCPFRNRRDGWWPSLEATYHRGCYEREALSLPFGNSRPAGKVGKVEEAVWSYLRVQDSYKEISAVRQVW